MINIEKLSYRVFLLQGNGEQIDISGAVSAFGWEESDGELAVRLNLTLQNITYKGMSLSGIAKPGCVAAIAADWGKGLEVVARGVITDWNPSHSAGQDQFSITAYDELFYLNESEDNVYIVEGTGTKSALESIFSEWGIPMGEYKGPDIPHSKTKFNNESVGDIILQLLDTAAKQGGGEYMLRADNGLINIIPLGSNELIYHFSDDSSLCVVNDQISTKDLVTRVKVVGKEDAEGRPVVEAIADGLTEYGIRQKIYNRSEDTSLSQASAAAKEILRENGTPKRLISVDAPDVPSVRKGDAIYIKARNLDGYFIVKSVRHDGGSQSMSMEIEEKRA